MAVAGSSLASSNANKGANMTRSQRRWHAYLWLALGPLIAIGLMMALSGRPPAPIQSQIRSTAERVDNAPSAAKSSAAGDKP